MGRLLRILIVLCCAAVIAQAFILCAATGWKFFTRYPDPEVAKMQGQTGLNSLFDGAPAGPSLMDNQFTFGLLPSPTLSAEALSVATVAGPALLAGILAMIPGRRSARPANKETAR